MTEDRNGRRSTACPLPESLNRLLLIDPSRRVECVEDPPAGWLKPTPLDRVLWWFIVMSFGAAILITSATMTAKLLN